ncbi:FMN adenylyltransferase /riboflavin kinase [Stella humosa]|uniref:Riboflavin biosynthesis protein n=1 Tax=Stella humosa TaxID=94 RepID=A0A3N1LJH4_9PROT|nr:bifunctional riboflavin kinase/FAD synthetase [Stella humosa]ROP91018.1 FMN adenylyltransferase /riboflavin kinase [Stella humosa]BBK34632.1 riboflavin biosynthesis protein [Stella humosa]
MRIIRHWDETAARLGAVLALGNFDGVHRGHRAVIGAARAEARRLGAPAGVLTFEPHPRQLFRPDDPPFRLTPFRLKARLMEEMGLDVLYALPFDRAFSQLTADAFIAEVLVAGFGVRHVVAGQDFVFGHDRGGSMALLAARGAAHGFGVTTADPVVLDGAVISSSRIRRLLETGAPAEAARLLGRPWEVEGRVEAGHQRGRTIGFPTANIALGDCLRPAVGVYAIEARLDAPDAPIWKGVANFGRRPTVDGTSLWLEVHLFDYSGDLYGRHLRVALREYLRGERKFDGLAALKAQIADDAAQARALLEAPAATV